MKPYKKSEAKLAKIIGLKSNTRIINCVVGAKCSGKTFETENVIKKYIKKYPKERILILDCCNEYSNYKLITTEQIKCFRKPSRIFVSNSNIASILQEIYLYFKGGLLVMDSHIGTLKPIVESNLFVTPRTRDIDIITTHESLNSVPVKLLQNVSAFRVHRSIDKEIKLDRLPFPLIKIAVLASSTKMVESTGYEFCYFDAVKEKIFGADNERVYYGVCEYYEPKIFELTKSITSYGKK